jgi:eukaryotic-like serine/threonine-protein kinase
MPGSETLEDQLRQATRNFTARLPEERVFELGRLLLRELSRAHAETPPRHPDLDPRSIAILEGLPRLDGGSPAGSVAEDLFVLGCLLVAWSASAKPHVSWRLDGPPVPEVASLLRRSVLARLASPATAGFASANEALAALEIALASPQPGPAAWPMFRGDGARTGVGVARAAQLEPLWQTPVGSVTASPVVAGPLVVAATADGRLLFLDRSSGRLLHELRLGSAVESSPVLADGVLWVGTDDGELVAVDVASGRESRRLKLGRMIRSSPLVAGDAVVIGVLSAKADGAVMAVSRTSGKTLWTRPIGPTFSSPSAAGDSVLIGSDRGSLHALDAVKGTPRFAHALGGKVRATAAVAAGLAIVGDFEGRLAAVRVSDGSRAWTIELGQPIYSSAYLASGLCIVGCHDGRIHAVDAATGALRFALATRGPVVSSVAGGEPALLAGSTDGSLYVFDAAGSLRQQLAIAPGGTQSSPALDAEGVYLGSERGVHAWRWIA